jgi:hypothetical protein
MSIDVNFGFIHPATVGTPPSGMTVNDNEPTHLENSWSQSKEFDKPHPRESRTATLTAWVGTAGDDASTVGEGGCIERSKCQALRK